MPRLWDRFAAGGDALTEAGAVEVPQPGTLGDLMWSSFDAQRAINAPTESRAIRFALPYVEQRAKMLEAATGIPAADWQEQDLWTGPWADDGVGSPARRRARLLAHVQAGQIRQGPDGTLTGQTEEAASALEGNEQLAGRLLAYTRAIAVDPRIPTDAAISALMAQDIGAIQRRAAGLSDASPGPLAGATEFAGAMLGGLANVADDPLGGPLLLAGGLARAGGKTILERIGQVAGREAAIGAATEIPVQAQAFRFNRNVGVPYTMKEAAANVLFATLGSAVLGGTIQGGAEALRPLKFDVDLRDMFAPSNRTKVRGLLDAYDQAKAKAPELATPQADSAAATLRDALEVSEAAPLPLDAPQERAHQAIAAKAREDLEAGDVPAVDRQVAALRSTLPADKIEADADLPFKRRLTENDLEAFDPQGLGVDAQLFQFKAGGDEFGVTERLRDVSAFEPAQAGTVLVWERADGQVFIVDGHQRMGIARRALAGGQDPATVFLSGYRLRETDGVTPQHARVLAAFKNIGEGSGSAVDVAKIYREAHRDLIAAMPQLSGNNALARDGRNLSKLGDEAFGMVINDVVRPEYGAIVGEILQDAGEQVAAIDVLRRAAPANLGEARAIVEQVRAAGFTRAAEKSQGGLFSDEEFAESLFKERAQILQGSKAEIRRDLATFRTLSKQKGRIQSAGNKLAEKQNLAKVEEDEQVLTEIDRLANVTGPVADALNAAARRLNAGELGRQEAVAAFVGDLRAAAVSAGGDGKLARKGQPRAPREVAKAIKDHPRLDDGQKKQLRELYDAAVAALPEFERAMRGLAAKVGGRLVMGPLKSVARAVEKILDEEGGDFGRLKDLVRGTIEVDTVEAVMRAADEIGKLETVGTSRNGYAPGYKLPPTAYRDVKANVLIGGHATEIQANLPAMIDAKERLAHPLYEQARVLDAKAVTGTITDAERRQLEDLTAQQRAIYEAAFSAIERNVASSTGEPLRMADEAGKRLGSGPSKASAEPPPGATATGMPSTSQSQVPGGNDLGTDIAATSKTDDITPPEVTVGGVKYAPKADLLGDDVSGANAMAAEIAKRDAARAAGQVSLETGDPSDLFSAARNQAELFQEPTAVRALERAQEIVAEAPERLVTIVDETGAERRIPAAQAFADLDAEEAALRRVALCATPGEA